MPRKYDRDRFIVLLLIRGYPLKQIAERMGISGERVRQIGGWVRRNMLRKEEFYPGITTKRDTLTPRDPILHNSIQSIPTIEKDLEDIEKRLCRMAEQKAHSANEARE